MTQVFFPGEKFQFIYASDLCKDALYPHYIIKTEITKNSAHAYVLKNGKEIATHSITLDKLPLYLSPRRVLMLTLYHALQTAVGAYTPWGALTGIRPSKMAREWINNGFSYEKVVNTLIDPFCCTPEKAKLALDVALAEIELTERIYSNTPPTPIGIYVSIPFCPTRCVYCSFNMSQKLASEDFQSQYISAMIQECKTQAKRLNEMGGRVSSYYIGGGTPTVLSEYLLEKLLDTVTSTFGQSNIELSVEAGRSDTLTPAKLKILRKYSVNRIAVNPQTLNDKTLSIIGRNHTAADFFYAFNLTRDAGFECINTDLIAGLPGETIDDMRRTMEGIATLAPENITVHTLAIKRASALNESQADFTLPNSKTIEAMLNIASTACTNTGLYPYYLYRQKNMVGMFENVGYSKPNHECLYNIGMMAETQTILGIGASAVSKFVNGDKISREFNTKNPEIYIKTIAAQTI